MIDVMADDALFFFQLLVPLTDTANNGGIKDDKREPYYSKVARFTNQNMLNKCGCGNNGPTNKWFASRDIIHFNAINFANGQMGGGHDYHNLWKEGDKKFCEEVKRCKLGPSRYCDVKTFLKYNDNREGELTSFVKNYNLLYISSICLIYLSLHVFILSDEKLKGTKDYDPANKFSLIYNVIIKNCNFFTKRAALDACLDETTWGSSCMSAFIDKLFGKKVSSGGQSVLWCDVGTMLPRAVLHRHKNNPKYENYSQGASELKYLCDKAVEGRIGEGKLWAERPHITHDNFFWQEECSRYLAIRGFKQTSTVARDELPFGIDNQYFHKEKTTGKKEAKAARFTRPIVYVKEEKKFPYGSFFVSKYRCNEYYVRQLCI